MIKHLILITLYFLSVQCTIGQLSTERKTRIDSLKEIIRTSGNDSILVNSYGELGATMQTINPELSISFFEEIITICSKNIEKSKNLEQVLQYKKYLAKGLMHLGTIYSHLGNGEKALYYFSKSLKTGKQIEDKVLVSKVLNNIGNFYYEQKNTDKALKYYSKSLGISKYLKDTSLIALYSGNIGMVYSDQGNFNKALKYLFKAQNIKNRNNSINNLINIGIIYQRKGLQEKGLEYFYKALNASKEIENKMLAATIFINISWVYFYKKDNIEAEKYANKGLELSQKLGLPRQIAAAADILSLIYEKQNKWKLSLKMHKLHIIMRDSINNEQLQQTIARRETNATLRKKEIQLNALKEEKKLEEMKFKLWISTYSIIVLVLVILGYFFFKLRRNRYKNELNQLRSLNLELEQNQIKEKIKYIQVNVGKKNIPIDVKDVLHFNSANKYVFLNDKNGKTYIVDYTLKVLENQLPDNFVRVHHSYIINKKEIDTIKKTYNKKVLLTMKDVGKTKISSSVKYSDNVAALIKAII